MAKKIKQKRTKGDNTHPLPPLPNRMATEAMMANLQRIMDEQEFASLDDAQTFLDRLLTEGGGRLPSAQAQSSGEQAQELVYQAWDAPTDREAAALARQALTISPDCADAFNVLAETEATSLEEACALPLLLKPGWLHPTRWNG